MNCTHEKFTCQAEVSRIGSRDGDPEVIVAWSASLTIRCRDCGQPFEFYGVPFGFSFYRPTTSINAQELRLPLVLPGTMPPSGLAGFAVTHKISGEKEGLKQ